MEGDTSFKTFLDTIRAWLALARAPEVNALAALVAAEQARRGMPQTDMREAGNPREEQAAEDGVR